MSTVNATNTIASVTAEPLNQKPGGQITLTASVLDDTGAPASGVTVTWVNLRDQSSTDSVTDLSGLATLTVNSDTQAVIGYAAYVDDDTSTVALGEACFYNSDIPHVFVPNGMDGELDKYDVAQGVQVVIDVFKEVWPRDKLTFWWDDIHSFSTEIHSIKDDFPITIDITNTFPPACLANGTYELFYQYIDQAGNHVASVPWFVTVTGGSMPPTLPAPEFPEGNDGWINAKEASDGTYLQIAYPGIAANDRLSVTWQVYNEEHMQLTTLNLPVTLAADDIIDGTYCLVNVPADAIPSVQRGSAQAWYVMTPANGDDVQSSAVGLIGVDTIA